MKRSEKQDLVSDLHDLFEGSNSVMVFHYKGLTVSEMDSLRKEARELGVGCKIVKNSLASIALKDTKNQVLDEFLVGPTAIAWGEDPVSCAKVLNNFAKKNTNIKIVGGAYSGLKLMEAEVKTLANLPSFDEIRGKLLALLVASATNIVGVTRAPATGMIGVLQAYAKK